MKHAFSFFRRYFRRSSESGQSVVLLALGFVALAGFVGITTDISLMFVRYAQLSRAVDSAAIAAANQMRQDRSNATVQLAARQFIEFYGVSPESVIVDTCLTTNFSDPDLCTEDQAKLVRVRAYFRQPTVFMRLLGVGHFDMWVSAISQTAALDVVIVMDVSESMAAQTTYADWAKTEKLGASPGDAISKVTNYGTVYRVPTINQILWRLEPNTKPGGSMDGGPIVEALFQTGTHGILGLLTNEQIKVNNYLTYYPNNGTTGAYDSDPTLTTVGDLMSGPAGNKGENAAGVYNGVPQFRVESRKSFFTDTNFPGKGYGAAANVQEPRPACRVRFYPRATAVDYKLFRGYKDSNGNFVSYVDLLNDPKVGMPIDASMEMPTPRQGTTNYLLFDGFVPTYNYFGCCNDPDNENGFDDLVCQPFKEVRAATFDFLDRIDFLRGDRAAFVTYNRTAFLVNPFPYLDEPNPSTDNDETKRPGAMLDNKDAAYKTLKNLIGVNAEPYFYIMTDKATNNKVPLDKWPSQSVGFSKDGTPIEVNFDLADYDPAVFSTNVPEAVNYPVFDNCAVQNAMLTYPRTLFQGGFANSALPTDVNKAPAAEWPGYNLKWNDHYNGATNSGSEKIIEGTGAARIYRQDDVAYEYWAACRSGNVGAALREANNALLNPNTSRRFGTIWIIVLMSDGGAGGSDPVRRNGRLLPEFQPYLKTSLDPAPATYGLLGEYGAFGLCPIGEPYTGGVSKVGELVSYHDDIPNATNLTTRAVLPNCADELPETRHTCDFRPLLTLPNHKYHSAYVGALISPLQDNNYRKAGEVPPAPTPMTPDYSPPAGSTDAQVLAWNKQRNNLYDVDIGIAAPFGVNNNLWRGGCDILYDVEDYARDWADYIAIANLGTTTGGNSQVPTIFTIGFAIEFTNRNTSQPLPSPLLPLTDPANAEQAQVKVDELCQLNVDRCLGEQLLRYIADVGDNNRIDNDYYQDLMYEWYDLEGPTGGLPPGTVLKADGFNDIALGRSFGTRDACQVQDPLYFTPPVNNNYDTNGNKSVYDPDDPTKNLIDRTEFVNLWGQLRANISCGNYYYSPNADQLQFVFDDIASRMFTRLSR